MRHRAREVELLCKIGLHDLRNDYAFEVTDEEEYFRHFNHELEIVRNVLLSKKRRHLGVLE
ncbi:unnamed protein product [Ilex paraguariensis]|uniref:Uncharacterized protein n=1 Tax=Ilex paraguariensis TaxID=185542 RepID=A0ABC8RC17_9AQUA